MKRFIKALLSDIWESRYQIAAYLKMTLLVIGLVTVMETCGLTKSYAAETEVVEAVEPVNIYTQMLQELSPEEADVLNRIVAAESQTQGMEGRRAVVEVILNRVLSDRFPNTVIGVLSQRGQFTSWRYRYSSWVVPELGCDAVAAVAAAEDYVLPNTNYLYFSSGRSSYAKNWIRIQDHVFGEAK